jgi:hypothetical protein
MSKGLHRNQEAYQKGHGDVGRGVKRAGVKNVKVAAGPAGGNPMPTPTPLPWNRTAKGERKYMNKGGSVKKRKGYKHGGVVHDMTNKPVEVAYTTAGSLKRAGIS